MKRVLIYGDSLVWGRKAVVIERFDENTRFTKVVQKILGQNYEIIEEGLRARTLSGDNEYYENRDGLKQFGPIFGSHLPIDLVIIMLGTNDMNDRSTKTPLEIADGLSEYFEAIDWWCKDLQMQKPKVMILSPPHINISSIKQETIFAGAEDKSKQLAKHMEVMAEKYGAEFFDTAKVVSPTKDDGVHIDAAGNKQLAEALTIQIKSII